MAQYRKKPVVIDAWQWRFSPHETSQEYPTPSWVTDALNVWPCVGGINFEPEHPYGPRIFIASLEGVTIATPDYWIIKGVRGELYPCAPDIFEATYEPV
jgi:hypothetical protein